jgi:hypothetical protein
MQEFKHWLQNRDLQEIMMNRQPRSGGSIPLSASPQQPSPEDPAKEQVKDAAKEQVKKTLHQILQQTDSWKGLIAQGAVAIKQSFKEQPGKTSITAGKELAVHPVRTILAFLKGLTKFAYMLANILVHGLGFLFKCLRVGFSTGTYLKQTEGCTASKAQIGKMISEFANLPKFFATFGVVAPLGVEKIAHAVLTMIASSGLHFLEPHNPAIFWTVFGILFAWKAAGTYLHALHEKIGHLIKTTPQHEMNQAWVTWYHSVEKITPEAFKNPFGTGIIGSIRKYLTPQEQTSGQDLLSQAAEFEQMSSGGKEEVGAGVGAEEMEEIFHDPKAWRLIEFAAIL